MADDADMDRATSPEPACLGGCSRDCSVFLCLDAGNDSDRYELMSTSGLARADIGSWALSPTWAVMMCIISTTYRLASRVIGQAFSSMRSARMNAPTYLDRRDPPDIAVGHANEPGLMFINPE